MLLMTEKRSNMMKEFTSHAENFGSHTHHCYEKARKRNKHTKEKIIKAAKFAFAEIDTDGNGVLDKDEVREFA